MTWRPPAFPVKTLFPPGASRGQLVPNRPVAQPHPGLGAPDGAGAACRANRYALGAMMPRGAAAGHRLRSLPVIRLALRAYPDARDPDAPPHVPRSQPPRRAIRTRASAPPRRPRV